LEARCAQGARDARGRDGKDVCHRDRATGDRRRGPDPRRPGREAGPSGRAALPRSTGAAHLRRGYRSAETDHRQGFAEIMSYSAHVDRFVRDNLPPRSEWPEFSFELPELKYPARLNCATALLDKPGA